MICRDIANRNSKILRFMERRTKAACATKESAAALLIAEGIYTADGRLSPEFGGDGPTQVRPNQQEV